MTTYTYYPGTGYINPIELPEDVVRACSHPGPCDDDIDRAMQLPEVIAELKKIDPLKLVKELKEYGCWNDTELLDYEENLRRILWIAACGIADEIGS